MEKGDCDYAYKKHNYNEKQYLKNLHKFPKQGLDSNTCLNNTNTEANCRENLERCNQICVEYDTDEVCKIKKLLYYLNIHKNIYENNLIIKVNKQIFGEFPDIYNNKKLFDNRNIIYIREQTVCNINVFFQLLFDKGELEKIFKIYNREDSKKKIIDNDKKTINKEIPFLIEFMLKNLKTIHLKNLDKDSKNNLLKFILGSIYDEDQDHVQLKEINSISYLDEILSAEDRSIFNACNPTPFDITVLEEKIVLGTNDPKIFNQYIIQKLIKIKNILCKN